MDQFTVIDLLSQISHPARGFHIDRRPGDAVPRRTALYHLSETSRAAVTRAATISSFGMSMSSVGRRRSDTPTCLVSPHLLQIRLSVRGLSEVKTLLPTSVRTGGVEMKRHIPRYRFVFSMVQPFRRLTCLLGYAVVHLDPGDMKFEPSASDLPH